MPRSPELLVSVLKSGLELLLRVVGGRGPTVLIWVAVGTVVLRTGED